MGQRDYGCPDNDRVHPEWRDLHSRALPVAPRAACGACSTPLTGAGTAPTTDRRQKRATCARPVLHLVADSSGVAPRWCRRAEKEASS